MEKIIIQKDQCEEEILRAVYKGRLMIKDMIGIIQIKKYRTMKQRYNNTGVSLTEAMNKL